MSMSKSIVNNAGARDPKIPRSITHKGERRSERYPSGLVERFVDLQGSVIQKQLVAPGIARTPDAIARSRTVMHNKANHDKSVRGFVEHDKCPIRHGVRHRNTTIEEEFAGMPTDLQAPCNSDPKVAERTAKGLVYHEGCPHIQWLMASRAAAERARRESRRATHIDFQAEQLSLAKEQAADSRRVADKLTAVVERLDARPLADKPAAPRKAPTE